MRHLTDEEIQSYLHGSRSEKRHLLKDHLNTCSECRNHLLLYERLGDIVLSTTCKPTPNDFERAVLKRLRSIRRQRRITDLIVTAVTLIGILTAVTAFLLTPQIRQVVAGFLNDTWQSTILFTSGNGGSAESLAIPLTGVLLLVLFAVIDRRIMAKLKMANEASV